MSLQFLTLVILGERFEIVAKKCFILVCANEKIH